MFIKLWVKTFIAFVVIVLTNFVLCQVPMIPCNATYQPETCDLPDLPLYSLTTVEDFERCAPALLPKENRNYFWGASGREITYYSNKNAYQNINIMRRVLRDVSHYDPSTLVLGNKVSFPVGVSPSAGHKLAHPTGEIGTAKGVAAVGTIYIVSSYATTSLEDIANAFGNSAGQLWMQTYPFKNRLQVLDIIRRAEKNNYKAIVVTVDSPIHAENRCEGRMVILESQLPNFFYGKPPDLTAAATFQDLSWIVSITNLPVVAKGILSGDDAVRAVRAGVKAVIVSNHGGRQLDGLPPTIHVLPSVVKAVRKNFKGIEVYVDGGIRTGRDVFKAMQRGANAVFVGRPIVWGLAVEGAKGVEKVLSIMRREFNETMILAGYAQPGQIAHDEPSESLTTLSPNNMFDPDTGSNDLNAQNNNKNNNKINRNVVSTDSNTDENANNIPCGGNYLPEDCDLPDLPLTSLKTVEEFERCGPAVIPKQAREYYVLGAGQELTMRNNKLAFRRISIHKHVLRDVSNNYLTTTVLGQKISFPIALAPTAAHLLADTLGEIATAKAVLSMNTIFILSSYATTTLEEVSRVFGKRSRLLWMQTYIFQDITQTENIVRRAEAAGLGAIVVTVDSPVSPDSRCSSREYVKGQILPNFFNGTAKEESSSITFKDLEWLAGFTTLPIVAKGILTGEDAVRAAQAGAAAVIVSNHGGRQLDSVDATIDALPEVATALSRYYPDTEVYIDGGVRSGNDAFKALVRGADAVFVGRPALWGLAAGGEEGVRKVLTLLKKDLNYTMLAAGYANPAEIGPTEPVSLHPNTSPKYLFKKAK